MQTTPRPSWPLAPGRFAARWWVIISCAGLLLASCQRAPRNAAELRDRLPRHWEGETRLQGDSGGRRIVIEVRELTARSEHVLEFNRVSYQFFAGGEAVAQNEAAIRGTITAPGGVVRLDEEGTEAGDVLRAGTFTGQLSGNLQSVEARWTTGDGQSATLDLHAAAR